MKKFVVCFNLGFSMEVDAEDEFDAEQVWRDMSAEDFNNFMHECIDHCAYSCDDDVNVFDFDEL